MKYQIAYTNENVTNFRVIGPLDAPTQEDIKRDINEYGVSPEAAEWSCEFRTENDGRNPDLTVIEGTLEELLKAGSDFIRFAGDRAGHDMWSRKVGREIIEAVKWMK